VNGKKELVEELRAQWKGMWRDRVDDKSRAEGIADKDYSQLFVERGTVIRATRKFRPPDFYEILQRHLGVGAREMVPPCPRVGGWGKFIRTVIRRQQVLRRREQFLAPVSKERQQLKKGGKGWLHRM